jgi:hypothetical protein
MKKIAFLVFTFFFFSLHADEKLYVDCNEVDMSTGIIYVHTGNNVWISAGAIHRGCNGLFVCESEISKSVSRSGYEKSWKCPYCYQYWPIGKPCGNPSCPSKYR